MTDRGSVSAPEAPGDEPAVGFAHDRPRGALRRHPWRIAILSALVLLLVAHTVPMAVAALPMLEGRNALEDARAALSDTDLAAAGEHLKHAEDRFRIARMALRNPIGWLGGVMPGVGDTQRTAAELALAGELVARGGARVTDAVGALPDGVRSLAPSEGAFPVEDIRSLEPALGATADDVADAQAALDAAPEGLVLRPVADARQQLDAELAELAPTLQTGHALADTLPGFLGADEPRRYFFGASQIAELRGTGGLIGAYAIVTADEGRLDFEDFSTIHDLPAPQDGAIEPPSPDMVERYERHGGIDDWINVGISADFPTTGAHIERLYAATVGDAIDGVIVADPFALADLLRVAGPADVPGYGPVDPDGIVRFVANEAFAIFDSRDERQQVLGTVATAALRGLMDHGGDAGLLTDAIAALGDATRGGHLVAYSSRSDEQAAFEEAGISGRLDPGAGDLVDLSVNSASNAKVDFFLEPALDYQVRLRPDGGARGRLAVHFTNQAPSEGQPGRIIGPAQEGLEAGDNRFFASIACATGCGVDAFSREGQADRRMALDHERDHAVLTVPMEIASGGSQTIETTWETPSGVWEQDGDELTYRLTLRTPPTVTSTDVTVSLAVPRGMAVVRAPGWEQQGESVVFSGPVRGSETLEVTLSR